MLAIIVLLAILAAPAVAQEPQLLFHASFDDGLEADVATGAPTPSLFRRIDNRDEVIVEIERTRGVFGDAIVTAEEYVRYSGEGNILPETGTVELWVKPLDWVGDDDLFHAFFNTNHQNSGSLILYKYQRTEADIGISRRMTFYVGADPGEERLRNVMAPGIRVDWQPGIWHHVAGTWERGRAALYLDGLRVAEGSGGAVPFAPFIQMNFGQPWGDPGPRATAIDEPRIWDRPLSAEAIRASFAAGLAQIAEHSPEQMPRATSVAKSLGFPTEQRVAVYVSAAGAPVDADTLSGELAVLPVGAEEAIHSQPLPAFNASRELFAWLDTSEIAPGDYELRVTINAPDAEPLLATTTHTVPERPPWWRNDLGMTDAILPPYTPIVTEGLVVSPWGRDYDFSDALVLRGLVTHPDPNAQISDLATRFHRETNLLAGPIAVAGTVNGQPVRIEAGQATIAESTDGYVLLTSRASEGGLDLNSAIRLEYDGITQVSLIIDPAGAELRDMRIEIPMPNDLVTLMNWNAVDGKKLNCYAGEAPAGEGIVWEESWLPLIWLGDEYRGLCWFNDRYDGWSGDVLQKGRTQLVRVGEVATLRLNFAPELQAEDEPITLNFCLAGTPTRSMPEGWRGLVRDGVMTRPEPRDATDGPLQKPVDFRVWWSSGPGMTEHYAYPVIKHDPELLRQVWNHAEGCGGHPAPLPQQPHRRHADLGHLDRRLVEPLAGGAARQAHPEGARRRQCRLGDGGA